MVIVFVARFLEGFSVGYSSNNNDAPNLGGSIGNDTARMVRIEHAYGCSKKTLLAASAHRTTRAGRCERCNARQHVRATSG